MGVGTSPFRTILSFLAAGSGIGTALSSACGQKSGVHLEGRAAGSSGAAGADAGEGLSGGGQAGQAGGPGVGVGGRFALRRAIDAEEHPADVVEMGRRG